MNSHSDVSRKQIQHIYKGFLKKKSKKRIKMQTEFQKQMKAFAINENPRNPREQQFWHTLWYALTHC